MLAKLFSLKQEIFGLVPEVVHDENADEAIESGDEEQAKKFQNMSRAVNASKVMITPVTGKTGAGYKVVMKPTKEEIEKKFS